MMRFWKTILQVRIPGKDKPERSQRDGTFLERTNGKGWSESLNYPISGRLIVYNISISEGGIVKYTLLLTENIHYIALCKDVIMKRVFVSTQQTEFSALAFKEDLERTSERYLNLVLMELNWQ